jgi:NAD-dependent SIR2 family protein deacetylase
MDNNWKVFGDHEHVVIQKLGSVSLAACGKAHRAIQRDAGVVSIVEAEDATGSLPTCPDCAARAKVNA